MAAINDHANHNLGMYFYLLCGACSIELAAVVLLVALAGRKDWHDYKQRQQQELELQRSINALERQEAKAKEQGHTINM